MLVFILDLVVKGRTPISTFLPIIFVNFSINFLSNIAWMAHIGGLLGGYLAYMIINSERKKEMISLYVILLIFVFIRFFTIDKIQPFYKGSDIQLVEMYNKIGFKNYSIRLLENIYRVYLKFGG